MIESLLLLASIGAALAEQEQSTIEVVQVTAGRIEQSVFDTSVAVNVLDA
jgi:hypothetical protein